MVAEPNPIRTTVQKPWFLTTTNKRFPVVTKRCERILQSTVSCCARSWPRQTGPAPQDHSVKQAARRVASARRAEFPPIRGRPNATPEDVDPLLFDFRGTQW